MREDLNLPYLALQASALPLGDRIKGILAQMRRADDIIQT